MIVNYMREMIGRDAVRLQDDNVLVIFRDLYFALDKIIMTYLVLRAAL